jgi:molecular chaperone DnaJ
VKGRGVETGKRHGDLIVTVDVVVPTELDDAQREAIEQLARLGAQPSRDHLFSGERT